MPKIFFEEYNLEPQMFETRPPLLVEVVRDLGWEIVDNVDDCEIYAFSNTGYNISALKQKVSIFYATEHYYPYNFMADYSVTMQKKTWKNSFHFPYVEQEKYTNMDKFLKPFGLKHSEFKDYPKTKFCNFIYGNKHCKFRNDFYNDLNKAKKVDSLGRIFNNAQPQDIPSDVDKYEKQGAGIWIEKFYWMRPYKFTITIENGTRYGAFSEKVVQALKMGTVPIYWGDDTIDDFVNPEAYIDLRKFKNNAEAVEYILKVDSDDKLYNKYKTAEPYIPELRNKIKQYKSELSDFMVDLGKNKQRKNMLLKNIFLSKPFLKTSFYLYKMFWKAVVSKRKKIGGW